MQHLLVTLLLAAHLLAMNVASAGPLIGAWLAGKGEFERTLGRRILRLSLLGLGVGSALGGVILLSPNPNVSAALRRFPRDAYIYAGVELLFSAACIAGLIVRGDWTARRRVAALAVAMLSAMNLLYHFPPLMAVFGELAADPTWTTERVIDRAALLRLWRRPEILALWTHFVLASFAVAAVATIWTKRTAAAGSSDQLGGPTVRRLAVVALAATAMQLPVGLWLTATVGNAQQQALMGSDLVATLCFAGGLLGALWLLQTLLHAALGDDSQAIARAGWLLILVTLLMTGALRMSRAASSAETPLAADSID